MSKASLPRAISLLTTPTRLPPPCITCRHRIEKRSFLTKRTTSFWSHSYLPTATTPDHDLPQVPQVPLIPPIPSVPSSSASTTKRSPAHLIDHGEAGVEIDESFREDGRKRERKERYLDSLMDKAGELSLRCSILDAEGNWTAEEGRYKKAELCKEHDLDPRDLRKLDSLSPNLVPLILTRRTCILISILHIRALIKPDRVIVFDGAGTKESDLQRRFRDHLERNVRAGLKAKACAGGVEDEEVGLGYEHRALESILVSTANALEEEMAWTKKLVHHLLADLEDDINRDNLKQLLHYSRRIVGFQSRARYVKRAVEEVLESDEDLSAMYITARMQGKPRGLHDHEQLELLLESFTKQVEEIVSEVDTTVTNMQSTQEIAELMLDSGRNALLALDIKVSMATLGIGSGALVAGLFGMNLSTELEQSPYAFITITTTASLLAFLVFVYGMKVLRRVRRVALSGRGRKPTLGQYMTSHIWDPTKAVLYHPISSSSHSSFAAATATAAQAQARAQAAAIAARQARINAQQMKYRMKQTKAASRRGFVDRLLGRYPGDNGAGAKIGAVGVGAGLGDRPLHWSGGESEREGWTRDVWAQGSGKGFGEGEVEGEGGCRPFEVGDWKWGRAGRRWAKD